MDDSFCRRLGLRLPVIQAPMAGVATPALAAAVSNAGALGSIGVATLNAAAAREMIRAFKALSSGPLNVNVFCHRPPVADARRDRAWLERLAPELERFGVRTPPVLRELWSSFVADDAMLKMLCDERPAVVSFHLGLPSPEQVAALRRAGIVLLATATNTEEGRAVVEAGIDAVVAQGFEAGGHRGVFDPDAPDAELTTGVLTRLLVREVDLPVISAGGVMDGEGVAACLKLGASAVQLGTAFVSCPESSADEGFRAALIGPPARRTVMTRVISGRPARSLANRFTALGAEVGRAEIPDYPLAYDVGKALNAAAKARGETGFGAHWAGQGAPLSRVLPAAELVAALGRELRLALEGG